MPELTCPAWTSLKSERSQSLQRQTGAIYKVVKYFPVSYKSVAIIFIKQRGYIKKDLRVASHLSLDQEKPTHFQILTNCSLTPQCT